MVKTKQLTIMFTDIKGFTSTTAKSSRQQLSELLDIHDKIVRPIIKKFDGKIIKTIGDSFMASFESPTDAVLCGIKIQEELDDYDKEHKEKIEVRIAINSGEVYIKDGDVYGEAVNIASRLEGIAKAGQIYFTDTVYFSMNKAEIPYVKVGEKSLKGIPREVTIYRVRRKPKSFMDAIKLGFAVRAHSIKSFFGFFWRKKIWILALIIIFTLLTFNKNKVVQNEEEEYKWLEKEVTDAIQSRNPTRANYMIEKLREAGIREDTGDPKVAIAYAMLYRIAGRTKEALNVLERILELNPDIETLKQVANEAGAIQGSLDSQSPEYNHAIKLMQKATHLAEMQEFEKEGIERPTTSIFQKN